MLSTARLSVREAIQQGLVFVLSNKTPYGASIPDQKVLSKLI